MFSVIVLIQSEARTCYPSLIIYYKKGGEKMSNKEVPFRSIKRAKTGFYDGIDYELPDELDYSDDIVTTKKNFRDADDEPIYNYFEPFN